MTAPAGPIRSADDLRGRRAVVLGLARSGAAASRFLADAGASVTAYDRRSAAELADAVAELGGRTVTLALGLSPQEARSMIDAADLLVTSPSISARFPTTDSWLREAIEAAEARGVEVVSEVDLFLRLTRARILGVTGTKGKTTTASLMAAMLETGGVRHVLGGNIGTPLVERALELRSDEWAVLELSELQLPTIGRGAELAVYTNVGADHLDRHGTVEAYRSVKARLAELSVVRGGRVILNRDDPGCRELGERLPVAAVEWYALDPGPAAAGTLGGDGWLSVDGERVVAAHEVPIPGRHALADVLAAAVAARRAGAATAAIGEAVRGFRGVPHRLELVGERGGVRWFNDSQATIPVAAIAALEAFDAPVVIIAGGKDKGLDYAELTDVIARLARGAVLIGETADELEALIAERVPVRRAGDMDEAVRRAAEIARPGDVALLAPAAASFDMFVDYAARGEAFRTAVERLPDAPVAAS